MSLAVYLTSAQSEDGRLGSRRKVVFDTQVTAGAEVTPARLHNISETGLLLEGVLELEAGEIIDVELPHVGICAATIVWKDGPFLGCKFKEAVSGAAISAALLRSEPDQGRGEVEPIISPRDSAESGLSPRSKTFIILGLGIGSWLLVGMLAWGISRLLK